MHAEQVARATAQEQGLPSTITDVGALARIAHLVVSARDAAVCSGGISNHEPRPARTLQGTPGVEVKDAA